MRQFSVMLPPGWAQFDLTVPVKGPVRLAVEEMLRNIPDESRDSLRQELLPTITQALTNLSANGAIAAYMSVDNPGTAAVFPVVAIRPVDFSIDGEEIDPLDHLVALVAANEVELLDIPGMVGIRRSVDRDASAAFRAKLTELPAEVKASMGDAGKAAAAEARRLTRQVEYTIGVPGTKDCWMAVSAELSTVAAGEGEDVLEAVTEFLDAWVGTVDWHEEEEVDG